VLYQPFIQKQIQHFKGQIVSFKIKKVYTKKDKQTEILKNKQIYRILGKIPVIASYAYRNRIGKPYNLPQSNLGYTENFLYMLDRLSETDYKVSIKNKKSHIQS
jgi:citrate synthase